VTRVERFEDVVAWQLARVLTRDIYVLTRSHDFGRDWSLASQMQRAAVSVMANVAEGFDREGSVEFHRFVTIARASCSELKSHLYVALDIGYLAQDEFDRLAAAADQDGRKLGALRASLKRATRA
jgi:four helix bundle protein